MDSYAQPKRSLISRLTANWMLQLGLLILLIVGFVIYDKTRHHKMIPTASTPTTGVSNTFQRQAALPPQQPMQPAHEQKLAPKKSIEVAPKKARGKTLAELALEGGGAHHEKMASSFPGIQISFYRVTRQGLLELQKVFQPGAFSGFVLGGVVPEQKISQLLDSGDLKYLSGSRYKSLDEKQPVVLFKGQRHTEAGRNMGLYVQLTAIKTSTTSAQLELKGWGTLKLNEPDENYFNVEMTFPPTSAAFVATFLPRDRQYNDDEKQLFESDRTLKVLNQEDFIDGSSDLMLLVEFSKAR
ncbi:MAG: hypothetical protein H6623_04675 [Bdellovibrionaceae bacterium]|nr:hypothetical protein [Pseudobdellovibrionaceae bacterium]